MPVTSTDNLTKPHPLESAKPPEGPAPDDDDNVDEESLLSLLQAYEADAAQYNSGVLRPQRDRAIKEFFQRPYGNEDEGWSAYVGSAVSETVEWMLPDLLDVFVSDDKAVEFQPTRAQEEQGAKDATRGVNHVFYQMNNGFMVLMTAFKDALMVKTCAVHWRAETHQQMRRVPFRDATYLDLALLEMQHPGAEIESMRPTTKPVLGPTGVPIVDRSTGKPATQMVYTGSLCYVEKQKRVKVEAFEPENLGVYAAWTSPLLEDCPYVVRWVEMSLSELNQIAEDLGFDEVEADELAASQRPSGMDQMSTRLSRNGDFNGTIRPTVEGVVAEDESATLGWVRIEWVLADFNGDGIAERREIWRLDDRILHNEECAEVPIATGSPIPVQHRWDGQSAAETVSDLQLLETELMRGVINNAYSANNPRKVVLSDPNGGVFCDVDDLLDGRPGGALKVYKPGAVSFEQTPYVGNQMEPLLARVDELRERRTGITKQRMGMNPNVLQTQDRTLGETQIIDAASKQRLKLIARVFAETIVKPIMRGILRLLTSGDFDPLFFKLNDEYVQLDPNEWQDHYALISNVGLGTGDTQQQLQTLGGIHTVQMQLAASPLAPMVNARQLYNTLARMTELGGFKNVSEFFTQPPDGLELPKPPPAPPPYQVAIAQMQLQAQATEKNLDRQMEMAKLELAAKQKREEAILQNNVQMANDERDARRAMAEADTNDQIKALEATIAKYKVDQDNETRIIVAEIQAGASAAAAAGQDENAGATPTTKPGSTTDMQPVLDALAAIYESQNAPVEMVRHPQTGEILGVRRGTGPVRPVKRNPTTGGIEGLQ